MPWFAKFNDDRRLMNAAGDEGAAAGGGGGEAGSEGEAGGEKPTGEAPKDGEAPTGKEGEAAEKPTGDAEKPTDREAKLLKEVMTKKQAMKDLETKLAAFGDVTPEQIQSLVDAENARKAEEADREKATLEKRGEFDRVRDMMVQDHEKVLSTKDQELSELRDANTSLLKSLEDMTVGADFSNSQFIGEELLLTPSKARVIYGSHFEVKDGQVVGYDKPAGAKDRTTLVDGRGEPLAFEDAIKKLVDADPERDSLIRAKAKSGAGSQKPEGGTPKTTVASGLDRITVGLNSLKSS